MDRKKLMHMTGLPVRQRLNRKVFRSCWLTTKVGLRGLTALTVYANSMAAPPRSD